MSNNESIAIGSSYVLLPLGSAFMSAVTAAGKPALLLKMNWNLLVFRPFRIFSNIPLVNSEYSFPGMWVIF